MRRINYYPELVPFAGSINSALMMAQLEFWFASTKGKKFYKFLEPCEHERYKQGDSWMEELGMSKFEIRQAFKRIGVVYKSKSAFDKSEDVFQGKPYASYYDRMRKTTYYLKNTQRVKKIWDSAELKAMGENKEDSESIEEHENRAENESYKRYESRGENESKGYENRGENENCKGYEGGEGNEIGNLHNDISRNAECEAGLVIKDNNKDIQIKTQEERLSYVPYIEICDLYNQYLGEDLGYKQNLSQVEKEKVSRLWLHLGRTLEDLKKAFAKASQSRFLCGKISGKRWRASLIWLLDAEHLERVLKGMYDDFISIQVESRNGINEALSNTSSKPLDSEVKPVNSKVKKFNDMPSHGWDFDEIERLEQMYIDQKIAEMKGLAAEEEYAARELA